MRAYVQAASSSSSKTAVNLPCIALLARMGRADGGEVSYMPPAISQSESQIRVLSQITQLPAAGPKLRPPIIKIERERERVMVIVTATVIVTVALGTMVPCPGRGRGRG